MRVVYRSSLLLWIIYLWMTALVTSLSFSTYKTGEAQKFRNCPSVLGEDAVTRKIVMKYLCNKIHLQDSAEHVCCERTQLGRLFRAVWPPLSFREANQHVNTLSMQLRSKHSIRDREFVAKYLLGNKWWAAVGELVIKEMAYVDCRHSLPRTQLLSMRCLRALEESLSADGSAVVHFDEDDIAATKRITTYLNDYMCNGNAQLVRSATAVPPTEPDCAVLVKYPHRDMWGQPTLIGLMAQALELDHST